MLDPKEEAKFRELKEKCRELKVPAPPEIMIRLQVHDKDGNLTFDDIQRGHSWTRNFYNMFFGCAGNGQANGGNNFGAGYMTGKYVSGSISYSSSYTARPATIAGSAWIPSVPGTGFIYGSAAATYGIVIGTSDTAFNADHYTMQTIIAHGNSADQLYYQAMTAPIVAYTAGSKTWKTTLSRIYNNNSGGSITVKETGLYSAADIYGGTSNPYLVERSVLSPTVAVANGAQFTVTYEITMDFSAID